MNLPTTYQALIITAVIVVPGFLFAQFSRNAIGPSRNEVDWRFIFSILTWGMFLHILPAFWTIRLIRFYEEHVLDRHWLELAAWCAAVLYIWPVVFAAMISWLVRRRWIDRRLYFFGMSYTNRIPTALEFALTKGSSWIKVHLDDGETVISGIMGEESAYDISGVAGDIYLEEVYTLDANGDFAEPVPFSSGVWISPDAIKYIEFYRKE